jgi:outer membrane protein assembly factor BamB
MLLVKEGGISTVFETGSGEPLRDAQRIGNGGSYFASPVYGDGKIYIAGENGTVVVLKNNPDYEVLAKNDVGDSVIATPAIADGSLFIRTRSKLLCVGAAKTK